MKAKYALVYVHPDESGNDDGVLDRREMTDSEANELNQKLYSKKNNCRHWIKITTINEPIPVLTHID